MTRRFQASSSRGGSNGGGGRTRTRATPYTLHRHPVFVRLPSRLPLIYTKSWEHFHRASQSRVSPQLCWPYGKSLPPGRDNVLFHSAIYLGDFGLAICHLKKALSAINETLGLLNKGSTHPEPRLPGAFRTGIRSPAIFDLRSLDPA